MKDIILALAIVISILFGPEPAQPAEPDPQDLTGLLPAETAIAAQADQFFRM